MKPVILNSKLISCWFSSQPVLLNYCTVVAALIIPAQEQVCCFYVDLLKDRGLPARLKRTKFNRVELTVSLRPINFIRLVDEIFLCWSQCVSLVEKAFMSLLWVVTERLNCRLHIGHKSETGVEWDQKEEPSIKIRMAICCQAGGEGISRLSEKWCWPLCVKKIKNFILTCM